jgi:23S rRNA (cytosine1962-C5)-methyltransferase
MPEIKVRLRAGRDRPLRTGHPWVFSGAVASHDGEGEPGEVAAVHSWDGELLGRGWWNPRSQIRVRMVTRGDRALDDELLRDRLDAALRLRAELLPDAEALRLVHGEGDRLPGFVADRYGDWVVVQCFSAGAARRRERLSEEIAERTGARGVWERSDTPSRREEGLEASAGPVLGEEPPERIAFEEGGVRYLADPRRGHKTGFYLDQRRSRALAATLAPGRRVLDCFAYTGAFGLACAAAGAASVTALEDSETNLALAREQFERNDLADFPYEGLAGNAFDRLRELEPRSFDLVVMDPPAFAPRAAAVEGAARGYKDVNLQALRLLSPGGLLLSFSCSHHVDAVLLRKILFGAASDSGRTVQLLRQLGPPPDHPADLAHLQGEYLKGFLLRVVE